VSAEFKQLATQARCGAFRETLPALLDLAHAPGTSLSEAWQAGAAAITILFWLDRFADAADLAEALITAGGPICAQDAPFDAALLAAEAHAGIAAAPRLARLAQHVPGDSVLGKRLTWLAGQSPARPVRQLLPNHAPWGEPAQLLHSVIGAGLLDEDYAALPVGKRRVLWNALRTTNQIEPARALYEKSGELPPQWAVCTWLAGWYAMLDEDDHARRILIAARERWRPYMHWELLPGDVVLQPVLRTLATEPLREQFLTTPIGPEAREAR
jgi:hypothetical protein